MSSGASEAIAERDPGIIERWSEIERRYPGYDDQVEYHSVRQHFGIRAFGAAAWPAPAGQCLIPPHGEAEANYHHEELYILLHGSARILCDGKPVTVGPGQLSSSRQTCSAKRGARNAQDLLVVGGVLGRAYRPPPLALDWPDEGPEDGGSGAPSI